jgi:hypothetical protein
MKVFVHAVVVVLLWALSNVISQKLFGGAASCTYTASVLFSWWFVAYFTKEADVSPLSLCITYVVIVGAILSAHYAGYYNRVFPNVPNAWTGNPWLAYLVLGFVMVTPLILNWLVKAVRRALA